MSRYEAAVRDLLNRKNFLQLDEISTRDRREKLRFAGGVWKLYILYQGLKQPERGGYAGNDAWEKHLTLLSQWTAANPNSTTARIAMAEALLNYRLSLSRSRESADRDTRRTVFHQAQLLLQDVANTEITDPHWYFVNLEMKPYWDREAFEKAIAFEPTYFPYYRLQAIHSRPEWSAPEGIAEKFADEISTKSGGQQGQLIYFEIAAALNASPSTRRLPVAALSWERIRQGYEAEVQLYGHSLFKLNQLAFLAIRYKQTAEAARLFGQIGGQWDSYTWKSQEYFEYCRTWASAPPEIEAIRSKAFSNAESPVGKQYFDDEFANDIRFGFVQVYRDCHSPSLSADRPMMGGDLYFLLASDGRIQDVTYWPKTTFSSCVAPKLKNRKVSAPPSSSYWVAIIAPPHEPLPD